jgi:hypothetical protein
MPPEINPNKKSNKSVPLLILVAIILIALAYILLKGSVSQTKPEVSEITKENVTVKNYNLASVQSPDARVPEGFPNGISIETGDVEESYSANYHDKNLMQYYISFISASSVDEKYAEYETYMANSGYDFGGDPESDVHKSLYGRRDGDDLSVVLSLKDGRTFVQLSYIERL